MSEQNYVSFLEEQTPVKVAIGKQLEEAVSAAPNAEKEEDAKEQKPKGPNETDVTEEVPKGSGVAAPNAEDSADAKKLTTPPEKEEPGNNIARWDGSGKLPATFSDPLLKDLVAKMDGKAANNGQNDPLIGKEEEKKKEKIVEKTETKEKSPLESLEEDESENIDDILDEDEKVVIEEDIDDLDPRESVALNRLVTEMDQISSELEEAEEDDLLDDEADELPVPEDDPEYNDDIPDDDTDVVDELI